MSKLAKQSNDPKPFDPLDEVPLELRKPALLFFNFYSDLLRGTLGVATRISVWLADEGNGITADDIRASIKRMFAPDQAGSYQYAGQVLASLSKFVIEISSVRRNREEDERRRADGVAPKREPTEIEKIRQTIAEGLKPVDVRSEVS